MEDIFQINTNIRIRTWDKDFKNIKKETNIHNKVVNTGLNLVRDLLAEVTDLGASYIAIGEDATAELATDISLGTESDRQLATIDTATDFKVEYDTTFEFGTGISFDITEAGLFDQLALTGATMFNRGTFGVHAVDMDNPLQVTITITFSTT